MMLRPRPKMKPCPFCGGTDAFVERYGQCTYGGVCNDCSTQGPKVEDMDFIGEDQKAERAAAARWNRRAS